MVWRTLSEPARALLGRGTGLALVLSLVVACSAPRAVDPSPAPTADPAAGLAAPAGPILFEPEQLIMPPEEFPIADADVARDAPLPVRAWERQFATGSSSDFRWFTIRLFVLDPDVRSATFIERNGCGSIEWPDEVPAATPLDAPPSGDGASACRYTFGDGQRVLYYATGFRNVGMLVGTQPRRGEVSDALALDWLAALARKQIGIIGGVLARYPPPTLPTPEPPIEMELGGATPAPSATPLAFEPPVELPAAVGGKPYAFAFCRQRAGGAGCDPAQSATRGGTPPYRFRIGTSGLAPLGLALSSEGVLAGTPMPTTDSRTYRFSVCVIDAAGAALCREVVLPVAVP